MHVIDLLDSMPEVLRLEYDCFSDFYESIIDVSREGSLYRVVPDLETLTEDQLRKLLTLLVPSKVKESMGLNQLQRLFRAVDACFYVNLISK